MNSKELGLNFKEIKTKSVLSELVLDDYQAVEAEALNMPEGSLVVTYLHYKVLIGMITDGKIKFPQEKTFLPKHLLKMRIFNQEQELHLWKSKGNIFKKRLRIDNISDGEEQEVVDAQQILWGTKANAVGYWTELKEDRGTELIIPLPISACSVNTGKKRIALTTRNYISYNNRCQAGYVDCRFVKIANYERGE
ncbi:type III-D CRISPR-associated protein Csx19 [Dehalobacterium formicoaceticum]|uniref:CRISPR-associated protein Csx19 n=1 Tax=Dehalobacterium formicoaceticum TaxID=51515 RepID=A0ABT1Y9U7_9FIRM|nr:CRISPR-associated protein Csx19 [Dehalobacterium formicoaceticum]MCR6546880.1 CRISPR-associated protein Csx19 [Dehalobacterium formicoaceticum]